MYFHRAGWLGDWIMAVRKLLRDEFDQTYHFREDIAQSGGNEAGSLVCNWTLFLFLYLLGLRIPCHWSLRTCLTTSPHIASLSTPSIKWAVTCVLNLKMSQMIIPYPISFAFLFLLVLVSLFSLVFLQQQVLLLAWSMHSAKVTSSSYTCITASPLNPCMHFHASEIEVHEDL